MPRFTFLRGNSKIVNLLILRESYLFVLPWKKQSRAAAELILWLNLGNMLYVPN
ncbi:hypothetical protein ABIB30_000023 [Pedobacter sp. UYP1]|jgi:hypothetical protein